MSNLQFIDTHCHLYLNEFNSDIGQVLERAATEGVRRFYLPAIGSEVITEMLTLEAKFPGRCFCMMGLHPCSVKENYKQELEIVEHWLSKREFAAIGEIGLDYFWDKTFIKEQMEVFQTQIEWAKKYQLPIVIHSRNSLEDCIKVVEENFSANLKGIFHCFSGNVEIASKIIEMGFFLGIGGVITYKNSGLAEVVANLPLESMVLETDAPYLAPVPFRGKRNESSYIKFVAEKLATIKGVTIDEVAKTTTSNAEKIFAM